MCQPLLRMKDNDRVVEWEKGLPGNEELTPLTQTLITPILATAFIIKHQPTRTQADVSELSHATLAALQRRSSAVPSMDAYPSYQELESGVGGPGFGYGSEGGRGGGGGGGGGGGANDGAGSLPDRSGRVGSTGGAAPGGSLGRDGRPGGAFQPPYQSHREVPYVSTSMQLGVSSSSYMQGPEQEESQGQAQGTGQAQAQGQGQGQGQGQRDSQADADGRSEQSTIPHANLAYNSYDRRPDSSSYGGPADSSKAGSGSALKKARKMTDADSEDGDSGGGPENSNEEPNARTLKRPRLVWTPQLHKRFVDAVGHLGIKNAVPKNIMQLMNVEGLTRENVASHLQKYRLYLKRMSGVPTDGPGANDQLFASTPLPPNLGSPLFMANHREDVPPPGFPSGVGMPAHMGLGPTLSMGPYGSYEPHHFGGFARVPTQRSPSGDHSHSHYSLSQNHHVNHSHNHGQSSLHNQSHREHRDHRDHREFVVDSHSQPSSPPRRILTLFPTSSH